MRLVAFRIRAPGEVPSRVDSAAQRGSAGAPGRRGGTRAPEQARCRAPAVRPHRARDHARGAVLPLARLSRLAGHHVDPDRSLPGDGPQPACRVRPAPGVLTCYGLHYRLPRRLRDSWRDRLPAHPAAREGGGRLRRSRARPHSGARPGARPLRLPRAQAAPRRPRRRRRSRTAAPASALGFATPVADAVRAVVSTIYSGIAIAFLTFFMLLDGRRWVGGILDVVPDPARPRWERVFAGIYRTVGGYVAGNLLISIAAGIVAGVTLFAVGVPFAIPLAILVGILDLIPLVGATIGDGARLPRGLDRELHRSSDRRRRARALPAVREPRASAARLRALREALAARGPHRRARRRRARRRARGTGRHPGGRLGLRDRHASSCAGAASRWWRRRPASTWRHTLPRTRRPTASRARSSG